VLLLKVQRQLRGVLVDGFVVHPRNVDELVTENLVL
jgi:hypothetical protein